MEFIILTLASPGVYNQPCNAYTKPNDHYYEKDTMTISGSMC
ncbi:MULTISPECIES: hypothetical protein [Candidatus Kuenenia]|nr:MULTISPECIES: hypothetical protein [Kuenenia]MCZ7622574.1 hypothetical protein [Candidatus Kuenenia sp.]